MLSSETSDIDCYAVTYKQDRLELKLLRTFSDTPFFFFTHQDRLLVDGAVYCLKTNAEL